VITIVFGNMTMKKNKAKQNNLLKGLNLSFYSFCIKVIAPVKNNQRFFLIELLTIILLLVLPYYLFGNKMYVGGDDTKLFYSYPLEFLKNVTFYSWVNVSSIGINGPSQYIFPFLLVWTGLEIILKDKVLLNHLAMSLPLIMGQIYFLFLVKALFEVKRKYYPELYLGSLFYITSPILAINQMFVFLLSIWLIGLIPVLMFYFLKYLQTSNFRYVYIASIFCLVFSLAMYAIPWTLGLLLPLLFGLLTTSFMYRKKDILFFLKKITIFGGFILFSQAFWLTGFISTYITLGQNSFASKFLSKSFVDTFTPTIQATATGTVLYPLLNLFHRQITMDFNWKLKDTFLNYFDKTLILNSIYLVIFYIGATNIHGVLSKKIKKIYAFIFIAFVLCLYLYTVNIGPLRDVFVYFRFIPGFTMFRNFFDKFAPGYVFLYSVLITVSLIIVSNKFPKRRRVLLASFFLVLILNLIPIKETVNSPLWGTQKVYKTVVIPKEYKDVMKYIHDHISSTNTILSVPFGTTIYSVVRDEDTENVYVGLSPVKIFSGVNDLSGHLSFNFTKEADNVDSLIINKKFYEFSNILYKHNVNYVLLTKNIPTEVLKTDWLYGDNLIKPQDATFVKSITDKKIFESKRDNYIVYSTKQKNSLITSKNLYFKKISQVKYVLYIKNIHKDQTITFNDTFHPGWNLYVKKNPSLGFCLIQDNNQKLSTKECKPEEKIFEASDLLYSFIKPLALSNESSAENNNNEWTISPSLIKKTYDKSYYKVNRDGSIDIELVLYFKPQNYFYFGIGISLLAFLFGGFYLFIKKNEKNN